MENQFDRAAEDIGNIVSLEHVNVLIPDQRLATLFYVTGLGLTRDPYMFTSDNNMWVNVGRSQFHLPTGDPLKLRGLTGLVVPDLGKLEKRLESVRQKLDGTKFDFTVANDHIDAICPWGNRVRCHPPGKEFGRVQLGVAYVQFDVTVGAAEGIARFYRDVFAAPATLDEADGAPAARVCVGVGQQLVFRETEEPQPEFDGHHIQVYIADFSGPHKRLRELGLITREDSPYQYRFENIVDPENGNELFVIEHEVRSMTHPLFARPLVNRNPDQNLVNYAMGYDDRPWNLPQMAES